MKNRSKRSRGIGKIFNPYVHKRSDVMKNNRFKVENVNFDVIGKDNFSQEEIIKLYNF